MCKILEKKNQLPVSDQSDAIVFTLQQVLEAIELYLDQVRDPVSYPQLSIIGYTPPPPPTPPTSPTSPTPPTPSRKNHLLRLLFLLFSSLLLQSFTSLIFLCTAIVLSTFATFFFLNTFSVWCHSLDCAISMFPMHVIIWRLQVFKSVLSTM